jgi:hypothetical protein
VENEPFDAHAGSETVEHRVRLRLQIRRNLTLDVVGVVISPPHNGATSETFELVKFTMIVYDRNDRANEHNVDPSL